MKGPVALVAGWQARRFVKQETKLWYDAQNAPTPEARRDSFLQMMETRQKIKLAYDTNTGLNRNRIAFLKLLLAEGIMTIKKLKTASKEVNVEPEDIARAKLEAIPGC